MIVNVEMLEFPEEGDSPVGRVIEILGHPGRFRRRRRDRHPQAPPAAPVPAGGASSRRRPFPTTIADAELAGRRDFRDMPIVTIDGETARDFDDAVWVDRLANGNYALHVHIADVSHYVRPGTPIDAEAAPARHQRLLPGPRRAHAAVRAFHRTSAR